MAYSQNMVKVFYMGDLQEDYKIEKIEKIKKIIDVIMIITIYNFV